ncbi:MAG TPA: DinB family protein [Candidatus Acidoferrum sp.]|jgi:uncharacterized damage-inducible protein DinB
MPDMQADHAAFLLQFYLPILKLEHATTRKVIEAIPLDEGDYRPDPVAKSALELAWHIVAAEQRFLNGIAAGKFNFDPITRPESVRNSADIAAWFAESFGKSFDRVAQLSPTQLSTEVDFRGMFQFPAVAFIAFTIRHSVHHRGQLSVYLRPMGAKVPAIYGESYDSAEARKAAQG